MQTDLTKLAYPYDAGRQLTLDTLTDRGYPYALVRERLDNCDFDVWGEYFGPLMDDLERALGLDPDFGDCEECGEYGVDTNLTGKDGRSVCDKCRSAEGLIV